MAAPPPLGVLGAGSSFARAHNFYKKKLHEFGTDEEKFPILLLLLFLVGVG